MPMSRWLLLLLLLPCRSLGQDFTGFVPVSETPQGFTRINFGEPTFGGFCPLFLADFSTKETRGITFTVEPVSPSEPSIISMTPANVLEPFMDYAGDLEFRWTDGEPITSPIGVRIQVPSDQLEWVVNYARGIQIQILSGFTNITRLWLYEGSSQGVLMSAKLDSLIYPDPDDIFSDLELNVYGQGNSLIVESNVPVRFFVDEEGNALNLAAPLMRGRISGQGNVLIGQGEIRPNFDIICSGQGIQVTVPDCTYVNLTSSQGSTCTNDTNVNVTVELLNTIGNNEEVTNECSYSGAIGFGGFIGQSIGLAVAAYMLLM